MKKEFLSILCCPSCKGNLIDLGNKLRCNSCRLEYEIKEGIPILTYPGMFTYDLEISLDNWNKLYRETSDDEFRKIESEFESTYNTDNLRNLQKYWKFDEGNDYLEIGCGLCFFGLELAKRGFNVVGIDLCFEAVRKAKENFEKNKKKGFFVCGDILHMPFKENAFDYIYGGGVIEHFKDTTAVAKELFKITKEGGQVYDTVPYLCLSSLTYTQLRGSIPDFPILRNLFEFIHIKLLRKKFMKFGYQFAFSQHRIKKIFAQAGFCQNSTGLFETYLPLEPIKNDRLKKLIRKLARFKLFWPVIYLNSIK